MELGVLIGIIIAVCVFVIALIFIGKYFYKNRRIDYAVLNQGQQGGGRRIMSSNKR